MDKHIHNGAEFLSNLNQEHPSSLDPHVLDLATKVYELTLSKLISHNQFLAAPLSKLEVEYISLEHATYMTEGNRLVVDPHRFLRHFKDEQVPPQRDILHILLHFLLLHPFVGKDIDQKLWNLACDMVVENLVYEILPNLNDERDQSRKDVIESASKRVQKTLTAEKLYRLMKDGLFESEIDELSRLFYCDSHELWYQRADSSSTLEDSGFQDAQDNTMNQDADVDDSNSGASSMQDGMTSDGSGIGDTQPGDSMQEPAFIQEEIDQLEESWQQTAKSMKVDLETLSRASGERLSGLLKELEVTTHEVVDYREFLRQFAVKNEDMRLSDEEFDYILYTYGLELYENMPLIEPLEYRTNNEIRDFCIVIDTSSSVTGTVVQEFINTTFDVLSSENTYAQKVNIHIIQCDNAVQSDTKITSVNEINQWAQNFKLKGFGGTDFRPAFKYINELYHAGEFNDLGGVIYFTDGWGVYPDRMPPYKTAFCFYDEDFRPELCPPWAIQLVLHPGQLDSKSVYS